MPEKKIINVEMSHLVVAHDDTILKTSGIGSCIVITIYDPVAKIGGIAHAMLSSVNKSTDINEISTNAKYVDQAIDTMVKELLKLGGKIQNFKATLIGGARMFKILSGDKFGIGHQNVEAAKKQLKIWGIRVENECVGGTIGRSAEFNLGNGQISVITRM